ncbi:MULTISPECIES: acetyltransferase [Pseudomonas]|uniref:acetyltransferase n=1 Tax=Pseudomonas TaxID=286 RepID=UPI0009F90E88|nr:MULTISPECIES: acetyltransferase [Pseudomonas]AZC17105.1 N-acetylglutamate synthase [Pseudomonas sp. CMR5c]
MDRLIILGAGGLGRQVLAQLEVHVSRGVDWTISGFLDERGPNVVAESLECPWLGYPESFEPDADHCFVVAVGDPISRKKQVESLLQKGARFIGVGTNCLWGARCSGGATFYGYDVSFGVDSKVGDYGFIDQGCMIGHDVVIGNYVHMAPRCLLAGYVKIGDCVVINSGAMLARGVSVGDGAVIGMGAVVFGDVPAGATVVGNPARVIFNKKS